MAYTGMGPEIFLPELEERPWGRFIDVVPNIKDRLFVQGTDRTAAGARWMAEAPLSPIIQDFDCDLVEVAEKVAGNISFDEVTTAAFLMFNMFECSELSGAQRMGELSDYVGRSLAAVASEALTWAATHALDADHLNLAVNSDALAASSSAVEAIGRIEAGLGQRISNKRGYIFVPLRHLAETMSESVVSVDNGTLVSTAGHRVIADAGLNNASDFFGTGSIGWALRDDDSLGEGGFETGPAGVLDRTRNIRRWLTETYGFVAFNPAHSVRTTYTFAESL